MWAPPSIEENSRIRSILRSISSENDRYRSVIYISFDPQTRRISSADVEFCRPVRLEPGQVGVSASTKRAGLNMGLKPQSNPGKAAVVPSGEQQPETSFDFAFDFF